MNNSLRKSDILKQSDAFTHLFQKGKVIRGIYVDLIYDNAENFKIGFAVSKRIKGAASKNKFKRRLREIYRTNKNDFPAEKNFIILAKEFEASYLDMKNDILSILKRIE